MIYAPPPAAAALSVSPARLTVAAPASRRIEVRNRGVERLALDVAQRSLTPGGAPWLNVRPARFVLPAGAHATLTLRVRAEKASAGDHEVRLLFTGRPLNGGRVGVRLRLGVGLRVRVHGAIARLVDIRGVGVGKQKHLRVLFVSLVNRGNVTEQLDGRVTVALVRNRRLISRLRARTRRDLFPGARTTLALRYVGGARGTVTAVATVALGRGVSRVERRYRLRL